MGAADWSLIWKTFELVADQPPAERIAWLDRQGLDTALRQAVDDLLAADASPGALIDHPLASLGMAGGSSELAKGTRLGPYRVLRRLGEGGMSVVYLAVRDDDAFDRRVVIKRVKPGLESEALAERLCTERRILAGLEHPNIARLYDGGSTPDGAPYFVMEHVDGEPIDTWCERHRLTIDERLDLVHKVCAAVQEAHQNLVVHRDLKPSNILVDRDGEPKLLDFGIAKLLNPGLFGDGLEPTATAHRLLTPSYASPEQIAGRPITTASDVYSLGVLLYKLLTGRLPRSFAGRSIHEIDRLLYETEPQAPSTAVGEPAGIVEGLAEERTGDGSEVAWTGEGDGEGDRGAPALSAADRRRRLEGDLDAIVLKALRSSPRQRYGSVEQLVADLERHQKGLPVSARAGTWRYRVGKLLLRQRRPVAVVATLVLVLLSFVVASAVQSRRVALERDKARSERDQKAQVLELIREVFRHSSPYNTPGEELTVHQALERSLPVLERGLDGQLDVRAELLHTTGSILLEVGRYEAARERLEEALTLRQALHGETHPDVALTLAALTTAHRKMGAFGQAETFAQRSLDAARRVVEEGSGGAGLVVDALVRQAVVYDAQGDFERSEPLAGEALALARRDGSGGEALIMALGLLARVHHVRGEYGEAERLNREVLAGLRQRDGLGHPIQITALYNLGTDHYRQGDTETAQRYYDEALELFETTFGEAHTDPYLFGNLANFMAHNGQFGRARALYSRTRDAMRRNDPEDPTIFYFEQRAVWSRTHLGEANEAETEMRRLLAIWRPRLGDHWQIGEAIGLLGDTVSHLGRCQEAEGLLVESLESALDQGRKCLQRAALYRLHQHYDRCGEPKRMERYATLTSELGEGLGPRRKG